MRERFLVPADYGKPELETDVKGAFFFLLGWQAGGKNHHRAWKDCKYRRALNKKAGAFPAFYLAALP